MSQRTNLPDTLCDLHEYNERLKTEFDNEDVPPEAVSIMCKTATPVDLQRLDRLEEEGRFSFETLRFGLDFPTDPHLETTVVNAIGEAEEVVRRRRPELQMWPAVVRWVHNRVGGNVEKVDQQLEVFCTGLADQRRLTRTPKEARGEGARCIHADARKRSLSPHFARDLTRLNTPENFDDLLRLFWDQWPAAAMQIPLPTPRRLADIVVRVYEDHTHDECLAVRLAARLKIPRSWLLAEADAGRIPYLQVKRTRLFNVDAVRRALAERAAGPYRTEVDS